MRKKTPSAQASSRRSGFYAACFLAFLCANSLLSYFEFPPAIRICIGLFGLLLPLGYALWVEPPLEGNRIFQEEFLAPVPWWAWILLAAAAALERLYRLTTLSVWPNYDDGLWGFFAVNFMHHWDWSLFYQDNSYPSTYAWGLGALFKVLGPSLFTLWLYPALLSILVVPMGYAAARRVFSKSFSFLTVLFLGLGFWPLFVGRFGNQQILTLLWECVWLWALGGFWKAGARRNRGPWEAVGLGVVTALGFYIYISWVAVAFFTFATVAALALGARPFQARSTLLFLAAFGLALAPLVGAGLVHNYARIVHDIGSLHGGVPFSDRLLTAGGYVSSLFWQMPPGHFSYQPAWGGLLDPVLGALFLLGLWVLLRAWREPLCLWLLGALVLFFVPGTLTHDVEPFRNLPLIPFLGVVCCAGAALLLQSLPRPRRGLYLSALVLAFAGLDFYHLAVRYHRLWDQVSTWKGYAKPLERYRAYQRLESLRLEEGPGLIYSNFMPGLCDQTLSVADHAFNAAENPDLDFHQAKWCAVLANANYKPFLERRFPQGRAFFLSDGLDAQDGGEMLWVMPVTVGDAVDLSRWQAANQAFCCFPGRYYGILRDNLASAYPAYRTDPFLESCYWEKLADLDLHVGLFQDVQKPMEDLEEGLKKGYGAAQIYQRLAAFHLIRSEKKQAEEALRKALKAPLDLTTSREMLKALESPP